MDRTKNLIPQWLVAVLCIAAILVAVVIYGSFDPEKTPFPRCPFYMLTGLKCPGCGSQRAIHQLLHLHIGKAFRYNALLLCSVPLLLFLFSADLLRSRFPRYYRASRHPALGWTVLAVILAWWLLRNLFGW